MKRLGIIAACIAVGCLAAGLLPGSSLRFIFGLVIGAALGFILASLCCRKDKAKNPEPAFPQNAGHDLNAEERAVYENAARMNQALRLDPDIRPDVLTGFESLIDRIRVMAPKALEQFPDSEMTYDLAALGKSHLPGLAARFLALSAEDRLRNQDALLGQLRDLDEVAVKAGRALDEGRLSDFEAHRDFLKAKFSN